MSAEIVRLPIAYRPTPEERREKMVNMIADMLMSAPRHAGKKRKSRQYHLREARKFLDELGAGFRAHKARRAAEEAQQPLR